MTGGNVVFPSTAAVAAPSPPRAAPRYSVDSFSEFSVFALSRMPTTAALAVVDAELPEFRSTQERDEELFRDLFTADNDWDAPPVVSKLAHLRQHKALRAPVPALWSSLGGACSPFSTPTAFANSIGASAFSETPEPTLSAPVPRLNLVELMTARPDDNGEVSDVWGGRLDQVAETDDEEGDERPESNTTPAPSRRLKLKPSAAGSSSDNNARLQQETLSFLERLDLKALLHTPRPDVLDFYPASTLSLGPGTAAATGGANQVFAGVEDARVEREPLNAPLKMKPSPAFKQHTQSSGGGKKESAEATSRLAYMETTYGTTKHETRKTRKGTIERLANPILGYTSTLQALSPEQRRRREMALGDDGWNPGVSSPAATKSRKNEPRAAGALSGLEHLSSSAHIYEAAAASSSAMRQRTLDAGLSNNQLDDECESQVASKHQVPLVKKRPADKKFVNARKAALKKKLENKQQPERADSAQFSAGEPRVGGSTFLTQPEDDEAKMSSRSKRPQPARAAVAAALSTLASQQLTELETRQPRPPPASVRASKPMTQLARAQPSAAPEGRSESRESRSHQKPKRSTGKPLQQQPGTGDRGRPSARRPFPRAVQSSAAALATASGSAAAKTAPLASKADPAPASAPKRKPSGRKPPSAAAVLLMGSDATTQPLTASTPTPSKRGSSFAGRHPRKPLPVDPATPVRTAHTPRNPAVPGSRGNATTKDAAIAGRRGRRSSKDVGGSDRPLKSSMTLPAIPPATARPRQGSDFGARRKLYTTTTLRRAKAS